MKEEMLSLPGYRLCEYLLVLQPHEELRDKIVKVKKEFAEKFEAPSAEWGKPQITLVRFSQLQMMEDRLINRFKMIAMAMPAFKVELKDFGSFPSHTIYINVDTKVAIQLLTKSLKPAQPLMKTKEVKPHFIDTAYIPLPVNYYHGNTKKDGWSIVINILQESLLQKIWYCYEGRKGKKLSADHKV